MKPVQKYTKQSLIIIHKDTTMATIEEKAKAYDEAIIRMKAWVHEHPDTQKEAEFVFPELIESEDEKIRKVLLDCASHYLFWEKEGLTKEKALAWLEKHEEQSIQQKPLSDVICDYCIKKDSCVSPCCVKLAGKPDYSDLSDFERAIHRGFLCAGIEDVPPTIIKETAQDALAQLPKTSVIDENYKAGNCFSGLIPCWVDAPSTLQFGHAYHGKNVVAIHYKNGGYRCCCVDDEKPITFNLPEGTHLVEGWNRPPCKCEFNPLANIEYETT